jgi:hypothetical protein
VIANSEAARLIDRLNGLPKFPERSEGIQELVRALERSAQSNDHAERIVSEMLEGWRQAPVPVDVYEVAARTREEAPPQDCERCLGSGWEHERVGEYDFVKPCSRCRPKSKPQQSEMRPQLVDCKQAAGGDR